MTQVDLLVADDPEYVAQFDVAAEALEVGNAIDIDLAAAWHRLRKSGPVLPGEPRALLDLPIYNPFVLERPNYTLLSYKACAQALRDNLVFSSQAYMDYAAFQMIGDSLLSMVGARHKANRAHAQPKFLPLRAQDWWKPSWISAISDALLDRLESMDRVDLNIELCARLPIHTVVRGIGIDSQMALKFRENLLRSIGFRGGTREEMIAAPGEVARMIQNVIEDRRSQPADDLISYLVHGDAAARPGGERLTDAEIVTYCQVIILAGSATTWRQLGMVIHALLSHYPFWEACRDDRSLIPQAVEETARWMGTQQVFPRLTTADVEVEGVMIPSGSRIFVCAGAANRDPDRWHDPDTFDIFREAKPHLGFGMGPHICLGMHVAKEEMVTAINGLMDRFPNMVADPDREPARWIGALEQRGMSHVAVKLR